MLARDDMKTHIYVYDEHPWSLSDDVGAPGSTSPWSVCHVLTCVCVRAKKVPNRYFFTSWSCDDATWNERMLARDDMNTYIHT